MHTHTYLLLFSSFWLCFHWSVTAWYIHDTWLSNMHITSGESVLTQTRTCMRHLSESLLVAPRITHSHTYEWNHFIYMDLFCYDNDTHIYKRKSSLRYKITPPSNGSIIIKSLLRGQKSYFMYTSGANLLNMAWYHIYIYN